VLAEVGRGGMGIVLRGHDDALDRTVAIKVLRPELATEQTRGRLLHEAQAAARFQHDHAVRVYAVAVSPEGLPYIVMEYLPGPTLAERIRTAPPLAPSEAAELVAQVADGLAAAHAAGLVHRDVKPGNIMLDPATARAKLLDFGLARVAERPSGMTQEGTLAGTPAYMSPEQAQGLPAIDGRSDVYGLGVTLYEALTGEVPFRGKPHLVIQQILSDEPRPPRRLNDAIPRDLETICLKAMAKEPAGRYPSAGDLAGDLRRWLRGEPVRARPLGAMGRGWRWCRRNPRVAVLSGLSLALLLALAVGSTLAALWIEQARRQADDDRARAETVSGIADQKEKLARAAQQQSATHARAAAGHFQVALATLNALVDQVKRLENTPGLLPAKRQMMATAVEGLERIARSAEKTPTADRSMVAAHEQLGKLFFTLGRTGEARKQYELMLARAKALLKTDPFSVAGRRGLAAAHERLGDLARWGFEARSAGTHYRAALGVRQALYREQPHDPTICRDLSVCHNKLGEWALQTGRPGEALASYREGLRLRELAGLTPAGKAELLSDLRFTYSRLGEACAGLADYPAARDHYQQSLKYATDLEEIDPVNGRDQRAFCYLRLSGFSQRLGEYRAAERYCHRCLALRKAIAAADPGNAEAQRSLYGVYDWLGQVQVARGKLDAARQTFQAGLDLCTPVVKRDPGSMQKQNDLGIFYIRLAGVAERAEHYADAARWMERVAAQCRDLEHNPAANQAVVKNYRQMWERSGVVYKAADTVGLEDLSAILTQKPAVAHGLLRLRACVLACRGRHREAAATAEKLRELAPRDGTCLEYIAAAYSLCAARAAKELSPEAQHLSRHYAERALATLRAGLQVQPEMLADIPINPDLIFLHGQHGYQKLLQEFARSGSP
jgi:serine/threonine-protein kinase